MGRKKRDVGEEKQREDAMQGLVNVLAGHLHNIKKEHEVPFPDVAEESDNPCAFSGFDDVDELDMFDDDDFLFFDEDFEDDEEDIEEYTIVLSGDTVVEENAETFFSGKSWEDYVKAVKKMDECIMDVYLFIGHDEDKNTFSFYGCSNMEKPEHKKLDALKDLCDGVMETVSYRDFLQRRVGFELAGEEVERTHSTPRPVNRLWYRKCGRRLKTMTLDEQIRLWLESIPYSEFCAEISDKVLGQEGVHNIVSVIYTYLRNLSKKRQISCNLLMAAPSGCGKTETFRALRDYFKIYIPALPIYQKDASQITEAGYRGPDPEEILDGLFDRAETNGAGIVFMDEFDKKLFPSHTSNGDNVNRNIQYQLLTMIEGAVFTPNRKHAKNDSIDTRNTLFIGMGAFSPCREAKEEESRHRDIGFGNGAEKEASDHYAVITKEDMIKAGGAYELLGRFSYVVNYHKLEAKFIDMIIDRYARELSDTIGCEVFVADEMREALHENANGEYGCRVLMGLLQETVMPLLNDIYSLGIETDSCEIIVEGPGRASYRFASGGLEA